MENKGEKRILRFLLLIGKWRGGVVAGAFLGGRLPVGRGTAIYLLLALLNPAFASDLGTVSVVGSALVSLFKNAWPGRGTLSVVNLH